ncbi:MAG: hypothetical protein M1827_004998 [Pycnora praestabilis]|nr:MAG: hypothetical protein M1827_004998 [Pycnora praestabilis]
MASSNRASSQASRGNPSSISAVAGATASILLDRSRSNARRSTPESEALASSDDEQELHHQANLSQAHPGMKPARRPSWLSEIQPIPQRKGSLAGSSSFSSGNSNPNTPSGDPSTWNSGMTPTAGTSLGRGHSNNNAFPWGTGIWSNEPRKEPPSRLTEVLPSPTSFLPPAAYGDEPLTSPPVSREYHGDTILPFAIPLHPTLKTYRSQSYSVGQMESESGGPLPNHAPAATYAGRGRSVQPSGLQHRPSRPSMLSEMSHDGSGLGRLREIEDDDESTNDSDEGDRVSTTQQRAIEQLAMENAMLRQAAADQLNHIENAGLRNRAATTGATSGIPTAGSAFYGAIRRVQNTVPEESDYAVDEADDLNDLQAYSSKNLAGRRYSEYNAGPEERYPTYSPAENRALENLKKSHWTSSLGFGGLNEGSQSRRHSFANVPARNASISSVGETNQAFGGDTLVTSIRESPSRYGEGPVRSSHGDNGEYAHFRNSHHLEEEALKFEHLRARNYAASYFSGMPPALRSGDSFPPPAQSASLHQPYLTQNKYGRPESPLDAQSRSIYGMPQPIGLSQPRQNQPLFIVTFKCCRADVFYVQEGTGLEVKIGDLVVVEADRGTDLGTVAHDNLSWAKAKDLKEYYVEEHYTWLMMFSRQSQAGNTNGTNSNGMLAMNNGAQASAVGGMGPPQAGQHGIQEPPSGELKPKMIKRLSQNHEVQTLRDKEGNEAKAKRVCQQKVVEHRLNMEILDAEFQMQGNASFNRIYRDWKKLTFYYFADAYINFNSLVTDLFKVYKTRIWMSAINPASFVTPTGGIQGPAGMGIGSSSLGMGRESPIEHRQQHNPPVYGGYSSQRSYAAGFGQLAEPSRESVTPQASFQNPYAYPFQPLSHVPRQPALNGNDYAIGIRQQQLDPGSNFASASTYGNFDSHYRDQHNPSAEHNGNGVRRAHPGNVEWMTNLQGLSLGTH